jgi:hypothetical protein
VTFWWTQISNCLGSCARRFSIHPARHGRMLHVRANRLWESARRAGGCEFEFTQLRLLLACRRPAPAAAAVSPLLRCNTAALSQSVDGVIIIISKHHTHSVHNIHDDEHPSDPKGQSRQASRLKASQATCCIYIYKTTISWLQIRFQTL